MVEDKAFTRVGIIMAGGSGERFWPLSRRTRPKQLLRLTSENETMLAEAVSRLTPLIPAENIYVVTGEHLVEPIREGNIGIPRENIIAEPCKRNTAGCLAYASAHAVSSHGGDPGTISMAVTTADHLIGKPERFRETVRLSLEVAEKHQLLLTHGIIPTRPETGYGYIQLRETDGPLAEEDGIGVFPVAAFHEKPDLARAQTFIETGSYYWNSGMFFWRVDTFWDELELARPEMARATREMAEAMTNNDKGTVRTIFETLENISIDYALMEHSKRVAVTRADYPWDDVGTWPSLDRTRPRDDNGNIAQGDPVLVNCKNCIVYNESGSDDVAVCVVGGEDLVVVVCDDGVLVVPKGSAQDVRDAVRELRARGAKQI